MADFAFLLKTGIALFAIVNPIGSLPIFINATHRWPKADRNKTARIAGLTVFMILTLAAFFGDITLNFFGIGIPSFQVGGGILVLLNAINMMYAKPMNQTMDEAAAMAEREVIAVFPISIPLLAGPGAISTIIIAAEASGGLLGHLSMVLPIFAVCFLVWFILRLSANIALNLGTIGINIVTRLMGLILTAMAVESIAKGLAGLFPKLFGA